jgi:hypothetical protein
MLDLQVVPEQGLQADHWELLLGMHFSQAVALVQSHVRIIKKAHVVYNEQAPLNHDLILDLPQDGFRLMFDSRSQRLKLVEVYNLKLVQLNYCGNVFNSPKITPTVEQIDRCFGATRPGSYDMQRNLFGLNFRGLSFYFPVDSQYQPHYSHGLGSLQFPGDAVPMLSKMILYSGVNPSEPAVPPLPMSCFKGHVYLEDCQVLRDSTATKTLGLKLRLFTYPNNILDPTRISFEREIMFGEEAQSVAAKLGTPSRTFYKSDDKMKIHSKEAHKKVATVNSDYFFNYFTLGLDILFDSRHHRASKFMLHTNFPGHYDFNSYHRCAFTLRIGRIVSASNNIISGGSNGSGKNNTKNSNQNPKSPKMKKNKTMALESPAVLLNNVENVNSDKNWISVNYDSHWEEVNDFALPGCQDRVERPVVLTRSSSNNPFGSSLCYGVQDMIFEVLSNDHIASVTLYQA